MEIRVTTQLEVQELAWKPAVCPLCSQPFASRKALSVHDSTAHRMLVRRRAKRKPEHSRRRAQKKKGVTPRGEQSAPIHMREVREAVS